MALLDFIYQAFLKICDTTSKLYDWLFQPIDLPFASIGITGPVYVWQLLSGSILIACIVYLIIRKFTI
jgi:hypothetical protein